MSVRVEGQERTAVELERQRYERAHADVPPPTEPPDGASSRNGHAGRTSGMPSGPAEPTPVLRIQDLAVVAARVDAAPDPGHLFRPVWPADAYGVLAAEDKAGKSWAILDAAVAAAAGRPWMGAYACPDPGSVLLFLGEGGERKMVRRLRAVAGFHDVDLATLAIRLCFRVPHLTNTEHVEAIREELGAHPARLVVVDPLYLAARGAKGSDLYEMGAHLEAVQHACQAAGAALVVVTHWNKTGEGKSHKRITGVGPGAWGRVLVSGHVEHRHTEDDGATVATVAWSFLGDEIPESTLRVRRTVAASDPDDLSSPMTYTVEVVDDQAGTGNATDGLRPATKRVLTVLADADDELDVKAIGDALATEDRPLKRRTIQAALAELRAAGLAEATETNGVTHSWRTSQKVRARFETTPTNKEGWDGNPF